MPDTVEDLESWQAELFEKYAADTGKVTGEEALEFLEEIGAAGISDLLGISRYPVQRRKKRSGRQRWLYF